MLQASSTPSLEATPPHLILLFLSSATKDVRIV